MPLSIRQMRFEQLVAFIDGNRDDAIDARPAECFQRSFLHLAFSGGHHHEMVVQECFVAKIGLAHSQNSAHPVFRGNLDQIPN